MTIIDKAKDLGNAILASDELTKLRDAEAVMQKDNEATAIIGEFQKTQQEFQEWQMQGNEITEEQKQLAQVIEDKMANNDKIRAYMEAQREFELLLQQINNIISQSISGLCDDDSCGPSCSGCN